MKNNRQTTKTLRQIALIIIVLLFGCEKENEEPNLENGQIEFALSIQNEILKSSGIELSKGSDAVIISIEDKSGKPVYNLKKLKLLHFNNDLISEPIALKEGNYKLTKFFVVDNSDSIIMATPTKGSPLAGSVNNPLPIEFFVQKGQIQEIIPEVIPVSGTSPSDFGYASFNYTEINTISFLLSVLTYNDSIAIYELTDAYISVVGDGKTLYKERREPETNEIIINANYSNYEIIVEKVGYETFKIEMTKDDLLTHKNDPLIAVLIKGGDYTPQLIAVIPEYSNIVPEFTEAMIIPSENPNQLIVSVRNAGAVCGGGTPLSIWKIDTDPVTGLGTNVRFVQSLSEIQASRNSVFENSNGEIFTGSGWCGYKPPYYSTDLGESWVTADNGPIHPPNSTFSFVEFEGNTYAGTGYSPYYGEVYKWLGDGNWEQVLQLPYPRTIIDAMITFDNQLFIGSSNYHQFPSNYGGVPVVISSDGVTFNATSGLSSDLSVRKFFISNNNLFLVGQSAINNEFALYSWINDTWTNKINLPFNEFSSLICGYKQSIFAYSSTADNPQKSLFISIDQGNTWNNIIELNDPNVRCLYVNGDNLFLGTEKNDSKEILIYRINL